MSSLPSAAEVKEFIRLLAPGLIILYLRSRVSGGPNQSLQERLIAYALVSAAYYAVVPPLFDVPGGIVLPGWLRSLLLYAVVPTVLGLGLASARQNGWEYLIGRKLGLQFAHHIPAAWDFTFSRLGRGTFILVTLANGSEIAGLMGAGSFASSSKEERDLLIEEVWNVGDDGTWMPATPKRSILLCGKDIRHVEIYNGGSHEVPAR